MGLKKLALKNNREIACKKCKVRERLIEPGRGQPSNYRVGHKYRTDAFLRPLMESFWLFCSYSSISYSQASFWCILSLFRPKLGAFRPTDVYYLAICYNWRIDTIWDLYWKVFDFFVLFLVSPIAKLHFGAFWAFLDQN